MNYLDSNIFLYPLLGQNEKANACIRVLTKMVEGEPACTSVLTWDEFVFVLRKRLGGDIARDKGERFLRFPFLQRAKVDDLILMQAQKFIEKYDLRPRDAIHAATAVSNRCRAIVSDDPDFDRVKEIARIRI